MTRQIQKFQTISKTWGKNNSLYGTCQNYKNMQFTQNLDDQYRRLKFVKYKLQS